MKIFCIVGLMFVMVTAASAQQSTTFRDASGRTTGTATTDSNGTTTFRDATAGPLAQLRRDGGEPVQTGSVAGDDTGDTGTSTASDEGWPLQ
jgi:hypothetical protein